MKWKFAVVREPGARYCDCLSDHPLRNDVNIGKARRQHIAYRQALSDLGLQIILLPREDSLPDSCFVEDTAVIFGKKAFITRMARESRRGEEVAIIDTLSNYLHIQQAIAPATIEGGDVIHLERGLIAGITQRTSLEGIQQMQKWLGTSVETITNPSIMHLKSYVTFLGKRTILITKEFENHPNLKRFRKIIVPNDEKYAANTLRINRVILMAANRPKSIQLVRDAGFEVIPIDTTEFEKCDGALTCLALIF